MSVDDGEIFYDDGDLYILSRAEGERRCRFRVHKHVLQISPAFNDMFTLGAQAMPEDQEVPVVELDDNKDDLAWMFMKLYKRHRQYRPIIRDLTAEPLRELARLAVILDKYSCGEDAAELKILIDCRLEEIGGKLDLAMVVALLPYLARLDHQDIQQKLVGGVAWGLRRSGKSDLDQF